LIAAEIGRLTAKAMATRFLRAGAIYTVANAVSAGVPFLLLPILTRALPPEEYGRVVAFFLLVSVSAALAGLNVHGAVSVKWFNRGELDFPRFVGSALSLALLSTAACALLLLGFGWSFHERLGLPAWVWPLAALAAGASVITGMRTTLWQSQKKAFASAAVQVSGALLNMALSLVGVIVLLLGATGRIAGALVAALLVAVVATALLVRSGDIRWAWDRNDLTQLLRFGVPLIPHTLAGALLATSDRFAVSSALGAEALGVYGAAAQLGMVSIVLGDALTKALSPWIYEQLASSSGSGRLRIVGVIYVLVPVWLVLALLVWLLFVPLGPLLLGPRYQDAVGLSVWFLIGGAISAIYSSIAGLFFFTSRSEWLSLATLCTAGVAMLLAPMLAARAGLVGAALAYVAAQSTQLLLCWLLSMRVRPMPWHRPGLALRVLGRSLRTP
jgi:O-antigen/teichoic acid export membrane protein